jgi:hypothetical protein
MDDLDHLSSELNRHVHALIEARRAFAAVEVSGDPDALAQARETVWQAGLALTELAFGNTLRERMDQEIAPLDDQGNDPETEHRRALMMVGRFMQDLRSIGSAKLTDLTAGDILRFLNGEAGRLLHPVAAGPGPKAYNEIDLHLMRRCVLRVYVECARQDVGVECLLKLSPRAPGYKAFRDWAQRVPAGERAMATETGRALRAGRPLSVDQATLWTEISDRGLDEMFGYILKLKPLG